jgi:hypothetical protein
MTRIDTSAQRAAFRQAICSRNSRIGLLLEAVADAWDAAESGLPSEVEARRWSPVIEAAVAYVAGDVSR